MKKTIKFFALVIVLTIASFSNAQCGNGNNPDNQLIRRAIHAAHQEGCLSNSNPNNIFGYVETTSICIVSGFLKKVTLYATPYCPPGYFCPLYVYVVATVEFGCDEEVISVSCNQ